MPIEMVLLHLESAKDQLLIGEITQNDDSNTSYKFLHDKIQKNILDTLSHQKIEEYHYKIALSLKQHYPNFRSTSHLFQIVNHLNTLIIWLKQIY